MTSARALLAEVASSLASSSSIPAPAVEARWIVERAAGRSHTELTAFDPDLPAAVVDEAIASVRRRLAGEPLQYIIGIAGFRMLDLEVGPGVFIPRPETEVVAGRAMELLPQHGRVVDVGTGSGAIALAIASERPDATVHATEASEDALAWARRNSASLQLSVSFVHCDYLDGLAPDLEGSFDVVVSNPPYVARSEQPLLPPEVVEHEPHQALFARGQGLSDVQRIAEDARVWLSNEGWLVMEIGETQGRGALAILGELGYRSPSVEVDLTGRDRMMLGRRPRD